MIKNGINQADIIKDFDDWNEQKKNIELNKLKINNKTKIKEGEIRWCRFGINIGYEIKGKGSYFNRPIIVVKKFSGDVFLGMPLTTKNHTGDWYYLLNHNEDKRWIILNQARVFDRNRLEEKIYEISNNELEKIKTKYCELILNAK